MEKNLEIEFEKEDLERLIYWIICKFKKDDFHLQGTSTRRDLIGGFFDRWLNRAPEFLIFRELLKDKEYDVVIDNFLYGQDTEKNAPDIIGLKGKKSNKKIKFAEFCDGEWKVSRDDNINIQKPLIEVKTFRKSQYLIAVGESQMESDRFYVFVESNIREDYLTALFDKSIFNKKFYKSLITDRDFIKSDEKNQIIDLPILNPPEDLGKFKLMGIFKGSDVREHSILVGTDSGGKPEKPRYFVNIEKINSNTKIKDNIELEEGLYRENNEYVPFYIKKLTPTTNIKIIKKLKGYFILRVKGKADINNNIVQSGYYKINFSKFDRSSKKREYIGDKRVFLNYVEDSTEELISIFDKLWNSLKQR